MRSVGHSYIHTEVATDTMAEPGIEWVGRSITGGDMLGGIVPADLGGSLRDGDADRIGPLTEGVADGVDALYRAS